MSIVQGAPEIVGSGLIPDATGLSEFNLHIALLGQHNQNEISFAGSIGTGSFQSSIDRRIDAKNMP